MAAAHVALRRCARARACRGRRSRRAGGCARSGRAASASGGARARSGRSRAARAAAGGRRRRRRRAPARPRARAGRPRRRRRPAPARSRRARGRGRENSVVERAADLQRGVGREEQDGDRRARCRRRPAPRGSAPAAGSCRPGSSVASRIADTAASATSSSPPPTAIAVAHREHDHHARLPRAGADRVPRSGRRRAMPRITPPTSSNARRPLLAAWRRRARSRPRSARTAAARRAAAASARYHAATAAAAVCSTGHMRPRRRARMRSQLGAWRRLWPSSSSTPHSAGPCDSLRRPDARHRRSPPALAVDAAGHGLRRARRRQRARADRLVAAVARADDRDLLGQRHGERDPARPRHRPTR